MTVQQKDGETTISARVFAIVLAAGQSSRFGSNKLVEKLGDEPLVQRALHAARDAFPSNVVLVTGNNADQVSECAADLADEVVFNPQHAEGIGTSIAAGVRAVAHRADALIVMLADQPLVTSEHLAALLDCWSGDANAIVTTRFGETSGPPVLFGSATFDRLQMLTGDQGAKKLLGDEEFSVSTIEFGDAAIDIDTPADLKAATR